MYDIDREIAVCVMGWVEKELYSTPNGYHVWYIHPDDVGRIAPRIMADPGNWSPSTRIDHAWGVVERMRDWGWAISVEAIESSDPDEQWQTCINKPRLSAVWGAYDATAPLAICKAALAAVQSNGE